MPDYPPSGCGEGHVTHFGTQAISLEQMKLDISNLVCRLNVKITGITHIKVLQYGGAFGDMQPLKSFGNNC